MIITSCPMTVVAAPIDVVWDTLTDVDRIGDWADAELVAAEPPGRPVPGQRVLLHTRELGLTFSVTWDILEVDPEAHRLRIDIFVPFGIVNHETVTMAPAAGGTLVRFG